MFFFSTNPTSRKAEDLRHVLTEEGTRNSGIAASDLLFSFRWERDDGGWAVCVVTRQYVEPKMGLRAGRRDVRRSAARRGGVQGAEERSSHGRNSVCWRFLRSRRSNACGDIDASQHIVLDEQWRKNNTRLLAVS